MPMRVLVVEDSPTVQHQLAAVIAGDPEVELAGIAATGREAVELCVRLRPDVVSMDMMLPRMTGLEATEEIMAFCPTPILIVSSSFNRGEVFKTYDALAAGAVDVLEKPLGTEAEGEWESRYVAALCLVARIKVITHLKGRARLPRSAAVSQSSDPAAPRVKVIAMGASTGGPGAAIEVLRAIPLLPVPILFVLHINPQFAGAFASWLTAQSPWPARFARDGELLDAAAGSVILASPDRHLVVESGRIIMSDAPERHSCRPSIDCLFESLAGEMGSAVAAALLTGMGRDGADGLLAIRQAGGSTFAQDEATSVVFGMPREAARIGAASRVLPIGEIGPALAAAVRAAAVSA